MAANDQLEREFRDAVSVLGFELIDDALHGPPVLEDFLADVNIDADAAIRALTSLCGSGTANAVALTKRLLDRGVDPEHAAWAARLWSDTRDGRPIAGVDEPLTDPEPLLDPRGALDPVSTAPLSARRNAPSGTVALLFTDIEGSTRRWVDGAANMRAALKRHDGVLRRLIEAHEGFVFTTAGDAFCAAFSHVTDAAAAAAGVQRELSTTDFAAVDGLSVRMAIHVGAVEYRDDDYFGIELSRVARILGYTHGGQITLSEAAAAQLPADSRRPLGTVLLRDLDRTEAIHQLLGAGLRDEFPPLRVDELATRIPNPPTSFVGRSETLTQVTTLVGSHRLVTLLGTGGLGKTRIAIEVARQEATHRPVVMCELAPATDRAALEGRVLSDLDDAADAHRTVLAAIADAIDNANMLLVLDNCEQIIEDVADFVEQLLDRCPGLTVLATSREVLEVPGERIVRVTGLHDSNPDDAAKLFLTRVTEAGVDATSLDRSIVDEICMRLDGLPLAIELAAAKTAMLSLAQIRAGLDNRLDMLAQRGRRSAGRHSSLRAMLDWSWELLDDDARTSLAQLATFASGFDIEAAGIVLDCSHTVALSSLEELLARSLIVRESDPASARYRLLESVRWYAIEKAEELGLRTNVLARHLVWVAGQVQASGFDVASGAGAARGMQRLDRDQHEIAAAIDYAIAEGDAALGLQTAVNLWDWWRGRLRLTEGVDRIEGLLAKVDREGHTPVVAGALVIRAEFMRMLHGPAPLVIDAIAEARSVLTSMPDGVAANRYRLRLLLAEFNDDDEQIADELWSLVEAARSVGSSEDTMALHMLTAFAQPREAEKSLQLARDTLSTAQGHDNLVAAAHAHELIAIALTDLERTDEARTELAAAIQTLRSASQPACLLHCAESVAWYLFQADRHDDAERMYAAAIGMRERLHRTRAGFEVHAARQLAARLDDDVQPDHTADIDTLVVLMNAAVRS